MSWVFISGSWMLWNREARSFMFRKFCEYIRNIRGLVLKPERRRHNGRRHKFKNPERQICQKCDAESACPNCIAKQVISRKYESKTKMENYNNKN